MARISDVTIHLGNYQGMRNAIGGKGRLQITIESLLRCCPCVKEMDFRLIDNSSTDESWQYIHSLPLANKSRRERIQAEPCWLATTINNMQNLKQTILDTDRPYIWNVENDSYFYNRDGFLAQALEVLEDSSDVSVVHLRCWVEMDDRDSPGVPRNLSRVEEVRTTSTGLPFYVMQKRPEYALWIPLEEDFAEGFRPDPVAERGKCPVGVDEIGAVRVRSGKYERLLTEHWNSYTSNGWIGRTADLKHIIERYNPLGERQMSVAFKKHFRAAKLERDAFVAFGWGLRTNPTEEERAKALALIEENDEMFSAPYRSVRPNYLPGEIKMPSDNPDVYS